jgi:frataxin-like iron-binding protein CyaY
MKLSWSALLLAAVAWVTPVFSQSTPVQVSSIQGLAAVLPSTNRCTGQAGLACVLPNLYGPFGLVLPNPSHTAHFNSEFQSDFSALNAAIATQLTLLPLASPASGFTYKYDPATGVYERSVESFGPVLTERAETIGRHRFYFGATFQRFRFDKLDGQPLKNLPAVFHHQEPSPYASEFISTQNSLDLKVNQFTFFGTYGLTDHIDISVAVPVLQIGFNATSNAVINRTVGTNPIVDGVPQYAHYFDPANQVSSVRHTFSNDQFSPDIYLNPAKVGNLYWDPSRNNAAGFGDVTFRVKGSVHRGERLNISLLADIRVPTGDEKDFLGSGAYGIKPFAALSIRTGRLNPHINLGYQWNGSSLLAGNILTGSKSKLPGFAFYSVGTDLGVWHKLTLAIDYMGQELINAPRIEKASYTSIRPLTATGQVGTFSTISSFKGTYNQSNGAFGFKYNVFGRLLLSGDLLVALNDGGLRQRLTPLIGLSYTF